MSPRTLPSGRRLRGTVAVVCAPDAPAIRRDVTALLPQRAATGVNVAVACSADTATVTLSGLTVRTALPGLGLRDGGFGASGMSRVLPAIVASLPIETAAGSGDPSCN